MDEDEVRQRRSAGPFAELWPVLHSVLGSAAEEPGHLLLAGDADGRMLYVSGNSASRRTGERAHLVAGARWHEAAAGTNGVGTSLVLRKPFQVQGAEHYLSVAVEYTCTAAPIRDPATGAIIGVVNIACPRRQTRSLALSLVTSAARLAEARLAESTLRRDADIRARYLERVLRRCGGHSALLSPEGRVLHAEPTGWLPATWPHAPVEGATTLSDGRHVVVERLAPNGPLAVHFSRHDETVAHVTVVGRKYASITIDGIHRRLGLRHSEIVVLLLTHPEGLTAEELAREIYGAAGRPGTVRSELARLRGVLGYRLATHPYRLVATTADFLDLEHLCGAARPPRPVGSLLPTSTAPGIIRLRERFTPGITTGSDRVDLNRPSQPALAGTELSHAAGSPRSLRSPTCPSA